MVIFKYTFLIIDLIIFNFFCSFISNIVSKQLVYEILSINEQTKKNFIFVNEIFFR